MARGRPVDTQRAAAAFTTLLSFAMSEHEGDVFVSPADMPALIRAQAQQLVADYGSLRAAAFALVLLQQHDERPITDALTTWSPETGLRDVLLATPGADCASVEARVREITSKTNSLRRVLAAAIRDPRTLIHTVALEILKQELPLPHCAACGAPNAEVVAMSTPRARVSVRCG